MKADLSAVDLSGLNVFDENDVDLSVKLKSLSGSEIVMPGFYYKEYPFNAEYGVTDDMAIAEDFRFRVSLPEASLWSFNVALKVEGRLVDTVSGQINISLNPDNSGYLSVEPIIKRNFVFDNGKGFSAVGMNQASSTAGERAKAKNLINWMTKASNEGANFTRMWTYQWCLGLQSHGKAPSDLSGGMMNAAQIDKIVEAWERNGMYGQLCLFSFNQLNNSEGSAEAGWSSFPYNSAAGGYLDTPIEFFTDAQAIEDTKVFLRYFVARYGYSTNLFAWELFNEADGCSGAQANPQAVINWHKTMCDYIRSIDPYGHMITTSTACRPYNGNAADAKLENALNAQNMFDFVSLHTYNYNDIAELASYQKSFHSWYKRPVMFGECGISTAGNNTGLDQNLITFHHQNWIGMMAEGCGTVASWYWTRFDELNGYSQFRPLRTMADSIPWEDSSMRAIAKSNLSLSQSAVNAYGYKGSDYAYIWMYDTAYHHDYNSVNTTASNISGLTLKVAVANGDYNVAWMDTYTGEIISEYEAAASNGALSLTAPNWQKDIALSVSAR